MKIKKASPGLDQRNRLGQILGRGFEIENYDGSRTLASQVGDADVLLVRDVPVTADVIIAAPKLKLIQRPGDHLVGVDVEYARSKGIYVSRFPSNIQGSPARDVAEHAFFLMLALAKKQNRAAANLRVGIVGLPKTMRVFGKTLGLVGVGNTGSELAKLAAGFGLRVIAVKRTVDAELAKDLGLSLLGSFDDLAEVLGQSDFVSLHLPMVPDTVGFIDRAELDMMKEGSFLINISRAPLVNKAALYDALASGKLGGAGLDVFWQEPAAPDDPFLSLDNVVISPHIAADTYETEQRLAELTAENVRLVARGEKPKCVVGIDVDAGS
jgi:phosphoglycerate dehydrogenase-like enzyme